MHVLRFMRKVDSLSPVMEIILKLVPLEYRAFRRRSWRKLDKLFVKVGHMFIPPLISADNYTSCRYTCVIKNQDQSTCVFLKQTQFTF